jgi:lipoyl(octanoyl) transferase
MQIHARNDRRTCHVVRAGTLDYQAAWDWQRELVAARSDGTCGDMLLLLQHPPTITLGRAANPAHILVDRAELAQRGVALVASDRGGDVTYHAPGQLVGYPILKLSHHGGGLLAYLRKIEETLIRVLGSYGIAGARVNGLTGVWVDLHDPQHSPPPPLDADMPAAAPMAKVAAIGVRLSASGITSHGFALNIDPDLRGFTQIVPCGIQGRSVTSLAQLLGTAPPHHEVTERTLAAFGAVFGVALADTPQPAAVP